MPFFKRTALSRPTTPPPDFSSSSAHPSAPSRSPSRVSSNSTSSWEPLTSPSTPPKTRPTSPSTLARPSSVPILRSCSSWDTQSFSETSYLLPPERNGDWRTDTANALKHPSSVASSVNNALQWPYIRTSFVNAADSASESLQGSLNRAFHGYDLPAMHDKVMGLFPSVSMPTMMQMSRSVDAISDSAIALAGHNCSENPFLDEELASDHLAFAHHMGVKARRALVSQRICKEWQVHPTHSTLHWDSQLDAALARGFAVEKSAFSVEQLFSMSPVWTGDLASKAWRLELDTGMVEILVETEGDDFEEKPVRLLVDFELSERYGCVTIEDVDRGVVDKGEWMAVK